MSAPIQPPRVIRSKEVLFERIDSLAELKKGWDSYGADPISPIAIETAKEFLSHIFSGPRNDGGVSFEIRWEGLEFSIEFGPDGKTSAVLIGWDRPESSQ